MASPRYQFRLSSPIGQAIDQLAARLGTSPACFIRFLVERTMGEGGALLQEHDKALAEMRQFHRDLVFVLDGYLEEESDLSRRQSLSDVREKLIDLTRAIDSIRTAANVTPSALIDEIVREFDATKPPVQISFKT